MNTEIFTLSCPLTTHNGELTALTIQEPTAGAFVDYGEPFTMTPRTGENGEPGVTFVYDNNKAFMRFLVDMIAEKGIDDLILKSMAARDFHRLRSVATNIILLGVQDQRPT